MGGNTMMTTADLKNRSLKTGIGYEKKDVDTFLDEIIASYEELYRSNVELNDRVNSLNEGLQHYKMIEASLQKTLVLAEKTAEETVNEAKEKAKQIEDEARGNTGRIALEAQQEIDSILAKKNELAKSYNDMKAKMKAELTKYIADLDNEQYSCDAMETVSVNETVETVEINRLLDALDNQAKAELNIGKATTMFVKVTKIASDHCVVSHLFKDGSSTVFMEQETLIELKKNQYAAIYGVVEKVEEQENRTGFSYVFSMHMRYRTQQE